MLPQLYATPHRRTVTVSPVRHITRDRNYIEYYILLLGLPYPGKVTSMAIGSLGEESLAAELDFKDWTAVLEMA
jgi:hypothetical protein